MRPDSGKAARIAGLDKIERAFEIRDELRDVLEKLLLAEKKYTRADNISDTSARTVCAQWTLDEVPDYTRCALLMGDVIHNLRAAMDHAVWAITPERIQMGSPRDVAFPLYTTEQAFEKWLRKRRRWYGPTVVEIIRSQQPFHAGADKLHPLHILQFLSNTDKHQLLNVVANNLVDFGEVQVHPNPDGAVRSKINDGIVKAGAVLASVEFARPATTGPVDVLSVFAFEQVFRYVTPSGDQIWLQLGEAMNQVCPAVVAAVGYLHSAHVKDRDAQG